MNNSDLTQYLQQNFTLDLADLNLEVSYDIELITCENTLKQVAAKLKNCRWIALDTEFHRRTTYYANLCLIQIYDGNKSYLIDSIAIKDLSPLKEVLTDPKILKIFHACYEDIEILNHTLQIKLNSIIDNQMLEKLALDEKGNNFYSLKALTEKYLAIEIDKTESNSDWRVRPLSCSQQQYAATDVIYLAKIFYQICTQNDLSLKKLEIVLFECEQIKKSISIKHNPATAFLELNLKSFAGKSIETVKKLQLLEQWRVEKAQKLNIPKTFILDNKSLYLIARTPYKSKHHYFNLALSHNATKKFSYQIINLIEKLDIDPTNPANNKVYLVKKYLDLQKKINQAIDELDLGLLDPKLVFNQRQILEILDGQTNPNNWRAPYIKELLKLVKIKN